MFVRHRALQNAAAGHHLTVTIRACICVFAPKRGLSLPGFLPGQLRDYATAPQVRTCPLLNPWGSVLRPVQRTRKVCIPFSRAYYNISIIVVGIHIQKQTLRTIMSETFSRA